jgi:hypothetical protein
MPEIGKLTRVSQGAVRIAGVSSGTVRPIRIETAIVDYGTDPYEGPYEVTPGQEAQVLETKGLRMTGDLIINPIPSNYGRITWDGSRLKIS